MSRLREASKTVALCVVAAVVYGVAHDQVTARVCVEYFTIGHPRLVASESPRVLALVWGVLATWWMGAVLGLVLALAATAGARPPVPARALVRPVAVLLLVVAGVAAVAGGIGYALTDLGTIRLLEPLASRVPRERHVPFLACAWAHVAGYSAAGLGGLVLAWRTWRGRRPSAVDSPGR